MQDDRQAIHRLFTEWHAATRARDLSRLLRLMSDDVVFLLPGQPPMRGKDSFAAAFQQHIQDHQFESSWQLEEVEVRDDLAFCWSRMSVMVMPVLGGVAQHLAGHTLSILRRNPDGAWVVARDANMLTAQPTTA